MGRTTPKLVAYLTIGVLAIVGGFVTGTPELLAMATPVLLIVARAVARGNEDEISVTFDVTEDRVFEGDEFDVIVSVESPSAREVEIGLALPYGFVPVNGVRRASLWLEADSPSEHRITLRADRWGAYGLGRVGYRVKGADALSYSERILDLTTLVKVYPHPENLKARVRPPARQAFTGSDVARSSGDGIEFASVRAFAHGDSPRHINWRVSSRRGELHVNLHHPEKNSDVVLFLDTFSEVGTEERTSLDLTVRGAASLAGHYLKHRDRVGIVSFGGTLRWLSGGMGRTQTYRIIDFLLDLEAGFSYVWREVDILPRKLVPPGSLVIAFSPLTDDRSLTALFDLRQRGFKVIVVETLDEDTIEARPASEDLVAHRLWLATRAAMRFELQRSGIPVLRWAREGGLEASLAQVAHLTNRAGVA